MPTKALKRLERLEKSSKLGRLPGLPGPKAAVRLPTVAERLSIPETVRSGWEVERDDLAAAIGDMNAANRVMDLQEDWPVGTKLELVIYDWLQLQKISFDYQVAVDGGRGRLGGKLPDFVIDQGAEADAWLANGVYWHSRPGNVDADRATIAQLTGNYTPKGKRIRRAIILWENRIMTPIPAQRYHTLNMALAGVEIPK